MGDNPARIMHPCLRALAGEWSALLAARVASLDGDRIRPLAKEKKSQAAISVSRGLQILDEYGKEAVAVMLKSYQTVIFEVVSDPEFPLLFSDLFKFTAALFSDATRKATKGRSLHTDQLVKGENLSEIASLSCDILEFLARVADNSTTVTSLDNDTTCAIFSFLDQDQPNRVRAAAGRIVSSLSRSPAVCDEMCRIIWAKFSKLKKDADFRNFAAWIDGIVGLQVTLDNPTMAKVALGFLQKFCENGKKIERGVLRMKFLDALGTIISRLNASASASQNQEYSRALGELWALVERWAKKDKHTEFCLKFLLVMLETGSDSFFVTGHGKSFIEILSKSTKTCGDAELLRVAAGFLRAVPEEVTKHDFASFEKTVKGTIFPAFFSETEDGIRLRWTSPEQIEATVQFLTELGSKHMPFFAEIADPVFADVNQHVLRLVFVQALHKIGVVSEDVIHTNSAQIAKWLIPVWMKQVVSSQQEFDEAASVFPIIQFGDSEIESHIAHVLFEASLQSTTAHASLCRFIERKVNMKDHAVLPIGFMLKLLDNIAALPIDSILKNLSLLLGITDSFRAALNKCDNACSMIMEGQSLLTYLDWTNFRKAVDRECLPLLMWPCEDVRRFVFDFLLVFNDGKYRELDEMCLPKDKFTVTDWCVKMQKDSEIMENIVLIVEAGQAPAYFSMMCDFVFADNQLEPAFLQRLLVFLASTATNDSEKLERYFEKLFMSMDQVSVSSCIDVLDRSLWRRLLESLDHWTGAVESMTPSAWKHMVSIYYSVSMREAFGEALKTEAIVKCFKTFCRRVWIDFERFEPGLSVFEKSLRVSIAVIGHTDCKEIVEQEEVDAFAELMVKLCSFFEGEASRWSFCDAVLTLMTVVLESLTVSEDTLALIEQCVVNLGKVFEENSRMHGLASKLFTSVLTRSPSLISRLYLMTYHEYSRISTSALLALANVLCEDPNFHANYDRGTAYAFAATIANISDQEMVQRQAAFKILNILLSQWSLICEKKDTARGVMTSFTSPDPSGFLAQAVSFAKFASKNLKPKTVFDMFSIFSESLSRKKDQAPIVMLLVDFIPPLLDSCSIPEMARLLAKLSSQCACDDALTSQELSKMWKNVSRLLKEKFSDKQSEFLQAVLDFGSSQDSLSSSETLSVVLIFSYIFEVFPEETVSILIKNALKPYDHCVPEDPNEYCVFWNSASVNLAPTREEIIATNALSQILLVIRSKDLFTSLFNGKLEVILLAGLMTLSSESYRIPGTCSLLESLLDAVLLRFPSDPSTVPENLRLLQDKGLITRASSVQYSTPSLDQVSNIVAYDQDLIRLLTSLFSQSYPSFENQFFEKLIAFAFQIEPQNPRSLEPFIMIMAMGARMSSDFMYRILLFTLYVFRTNRSELMDCLIDCVKFHVLALTPESPEFGDEAIPVLLILLLYLSLDLRISLAAHIMKIIGQILTVVSSSSCKENVHSAIVEYLQPFEGGKFVAFQFLRFIQKATTFGDDSAKVMIETLDIMSGLFPESDNWCSLLALLIDGSRRFIGEKGQRPVENVLPQHTYQSIREFANCLSSSTKNQEMRAFMISFFCNILTSFKSVDYNRDSAVVCMIVALCECDYEIPEAMHDNLIRFLMLARMSTDEHSQIFCAPFLAKNLSAAALLIPRFVDVKERPYNATLPHDRSVVDPSCLPSFPLSESDAKKDDVVDSAWNFISEKLGKGEIRFVPPSSV